MFERGKIKNKTQYNCKVTEDKVRKVRIHLSFSIYNIVEEEEKEAKSMHITTKEKNATFAPVTFRTYLLVVRQFG